MHVCRPSEEDHETLLLAPRSDDGARHLARGAGPPDLVATSGGIPSAEVRQLLRDPRGICRQLGLCERAHPQPQGLLILCPWHAERTPSCSVRLGGDGTIAVHCFACGRGGDVFHLVAAVYRLDLRRDFPEVLRLAAALADGVVSSPHAGAAHDAGLAERPYPAAEELAKTWEATGRTSDDCEVANYLRARALDPVAIDRLGLARTLSLGTVTPRWASYRGQSWVQTGHRIVFPAFDSRGVMRSVRAWGVRANGIPKRLSPARRRIAGLVLANSAALTLLRREAPAPNEVVFVEGEPDMATWSLRLYQAGRSREVAVFGLFAGGWSREHADSVPVGALVCVRTHHDAAGDRYAREVNETLGRRCRVRRLVREEVGGHV
jgi:DNA primase